MKKYIRVTALFLLLAVLFTFLVSCNKPDDTTVPPSDEQPPSGNENSQKPPKTSIKELHYDNRKVRSSFGEYIKFSDVIVYGPEYSSPDTDVYHSSIDFESQHTYFPIDDVTVDVYYGWGAKIKNEDIRAHKLCITNGEGKSVFVNYVNDTYSSEKYLRTKTTETTSEYIKTDYTYSHSEKLTIPADMFLYGRGTISVQLYGINIGVVIPEMAPQSDRLKIYYKTDGETVELFGGFDLKWSCPLFLDQEQVPESNIFDDWCLNAYVQQTDLTQKFGEIVFYSPKVYQFGSRYSLSVVFSGKNGMNSIFVFDPSDGIAIAKKYSFRYEGDFYVDDRGIDTWLTFYLWDDNLIFRTTSKGEGTSHIYKIKNVTENDKLREEFVEEPIEEQTVIEGYTFTLVKNSDGKYTKIIVTKPDGTQDVYGA